MGQNTYTLNYHLNHVMRKTDFCLFENKGADQLHSKCEADQRLCFHYMKSTIPLLLKSEISSSYPSASIHMRLHGPVCIGHGRKPEDQFYRVAAHLCVELCYGILWHTSDTPGSHADGYIVFALFSSLVCYLFGLFNS